ncbi:BTB/POZ domain-containing protein [Megavirus baoshan]|uniref:BTB/POZ domain-containing protein n=1 Tax=Megavirus baoshan TaxID=2496520 RepID=A0A8K1W7J1_9VIRU|nr:BTB/POZ domain-containing protein [Megavirus baoshan]UFX99910.1 BTB/POZ domain-containing protein [Megavirus baoshan]
MIFIKIEIYICKVGLRLLIMLTARRVNLISNNNLTMNDFCKVFNSEFLSDVKIILVDDKKQLSLNLHRIVLSTRCKFFEKMFSNFNQQFKNIMQVIDVDIAQDIFKFFYGFELNQSDDWQYKLKYYICCDYFGLDCVLPTDIKVSSDCFDDLLDLVEIIGYTDETIKLLANNLPSDYDISTLPIELVKEINNHIYSSDMIVMSNQNQTKYDRVINMDIVNKDIIKIKHIYQKEYCKNLCYLSKINKIAFTVENKLLIYDLNTDKIQEHEWNNITFESLKYNQIKNELIAFVHNVKEKTSSIHIVCVNTWNIIETICHTNPNIVIKNICLTSSCDKLAFVLEKSYSDTWKTKKYIQVYDFKTKKHTIIYKSYDYYIVKLKFIHNDTSVVFCSRHNSNTRYEMSLYNISGKGECIYKLSNDIYDFDVYLDKYLLIVSDNKFILFDFIEKTVVYKFDAYFNKVKVIPGGKMITYGYEPTIIYDIMRGKSSARELDLPDVRSFCFINLQTSLKKRIEDYIRA